MLKLLSRITHCAKLFIFSLVWLLPILTLLACSAGDKKKANSSHQQATLTSRPASKGLPVTEAENRAKRISHVKYNLAFKIEAEKTFFSGTNEITFQLSDATQPLTIDFADGEILAITLNGKPLEKTHYNGFFFVLPAQSITDTTTPTLKTGENHVNVQFRHPYSKDGTGLYRFKDPEDGRVYTYTHFEPYDANKLFPCFDQPNLKAYYRLQVQAPLDWVVISAAREEKVETVDKQKNWFFPETGPFSTYVFSLHAGPYVSWQSKAGTIPLRLFARQTMAKYVHYEEWFTITRQGFEFFEKYFAYPYPFKKYDQVIVPDFNTGAMENVAAVTFKEKYLQRGASTYSERESLANVILHEMAHMWFGNLVTMQWWNDLWLNESFATYMATLASAENTEFKNAWRTFTASMKEWAYQEDQLVTTHPIETPVASTEVAFVNFDGITYAKGASSLKQMAYLLGAEPYQKGVQNYFQQYAFNNAERKDFIAALEKNSHKSLQQWTKEWLQSAGLNSVEATYQCNKQNLISSFELQQKPPKDSSSNIREHSMEVALLSGNPLHVTQSAKITYRATAKIAEFEGTPCPDVVLLNYHDYDYIKAHIDNKSLAILRTRLGKITDPLIRTLFWQSLKEMVTDAEISALSFLDIVFHNFGGETEENLVAGSDEPQDLETENDSYIVEGVGNFINRTRDLLPIAPANAKRYSDSISKKIEDFFWNQLALARPGSDLQLQWYDLYVASAKTVPALSRLVALLSGNQTINGLKIDQERRWKTIIRLATMGHSQAESIRTAESKKDGSERGIISTLSAEAAMPNLAIKEKWFKQITTGSDLSLARQEAILNNLFPPEQIELKRLFADKYLDALQRMKHFADNELLGLFASKVAPAFCEQTSVDYLANLITKANALPPIVIKNMKIAHQMDQQCVKARELIMKEIQNIKMD